MNILDIMSYLFGLGFSLILGVLKIIFIIIVVAVAYFKGRSTWIWGGLTLLLPWPCPLVTLFLVSYLPKRYPKLPRELRAQTAFEGKNPVIASLMALCAMIAKADGSVTKEEIEFIRQFILAHFNMSARELNEYEGAFNYGKNHPDDYLQFTHIVTGYYRTRPDYIRLIAYLLVGVAMQQGESTAAKEVQTKKILLNLGISEYEYQALRMAFVGSTSGYGQSYGGEQAYGRYENPQDLVKKYTEVLGVSEDASLADIKKAYRKLVKEYHPDKLAAGSAPPEYIEFANEKIRQVNEAYEYLEKVKGGK